MDSTLLRTFIEVIETGSLVGAAKRLNVTQSTVTARINALEQDIGQKLIHRNKSGTEMTSAGFKLKRYAEVMLQLWRQARFETSLPKGFVNVCNLGCEFDLWRDVATRLLDHMAERTPEVAVAAWPGEQRQLDRWLNIGLVDVALCYTPQPGGNFATHILFDDDLVLVSSLTDASNPKRDGIRRSGYIYVDHGDDFRRQHAIEFPGDETAAVTIASADWALDYLLRRGGSGYLPSRHVGAAIASGQLREVGDAPRFKRRVYVVANTQVTAQWDWFEDALAALRRQPVSAASPAATGPASPSRDRAASA